MSAWRFLFSPPIHVSSAITVPRSRLDWLALHGLADAVEHVPGRLVSDAVLPADLPRGDAAAQTPKITSSQVRILIFVPWKIVLVRTLNCDALVLQVREGRRVVNVQALIATGVNADGHREILGLQVTSAENAPAG